MKYLESSIALRIMDCFGIFTKDMPDIRSDFFKVGKQNIWALCTTSDKDGDFFCLYAEKSDKKYLVSSIGTEADKSKLWLCIIAGDPAEENPDMNRIFILKTAAENKWVIRETDTIEAANMLVTFECFRQFFNGWTQYKPTENDMFVIKKFIGSIVEEDVEE